MYVLKKFKLIISLPHFNGLFHLLELEIQKVFNGQNNLSTISNYSQPSPASDTTDVNENHFRYENIVPKVRRDSKFVIEIRDLSLIG